MAAPVHMAPHEFAPATSAWLKNAFDAPTRVQREGWPAILRGDHTLMLAPTGSGKTLAAFLAAIDRLLTTPPLNDVEKGVRVLYVSPLKALAVDVERNLRAPLIGIGREADHLGVALRPVEIDVRTGDTPARERQRQARAPGDILVTTPESLFLLLTSRGGDVLRTVETVIIDEIHVLAGTKRGVHMALSLERLEAHVGRPVQRIGLSATQRPLERIASFLVGVGRDVTIVDASEPPRIDLRIEVPVDDMEAPVRNSSSRTATNDTETGAAAPVLAATSEAKPRSRRSQVPRESGGKLPTDNSASEGGIWPSVYPAILKEIEAHTSTIVFTNSRILCERIAQKVNELAGRELVRTHHGSLAHARRAEVEDLLKQGKLPAIVATSSLELGIDMGAVDHVILVESPGSAARGIQRVGRASHHVGGTSSAVLYPKYRHDLLESVVVADAMARGVIEETRVPQNCLDVLAQQIVAIVAMAPISVDELETLVRRASPYRDLSRDVLESVLDMLAGRFPSDELADLSPRIVWDRVENVLTPRRGAKSLAVMNAGTIPDRGLYTVHIAGEGPRIGELDEEMAYESREGDTIILGSSTWRIEEITRDRISVTPAPGEPGRLPFWRGERLGRPIAVGRALGKFLRDVEPLSFDDIKTAARAMANVDDKAANNLARYIVEQRESTRALPSDRTIVVERFRDEIGDWRICVLTPFGSRVHMPWALAIQNHLSESSGFQVDVMWSDDGIALRLADTDEIPSAEILFPSADDVEDRVIHELERSALFASTFRESAGRALLLPRRRMGARTPLWLQRRRSESLLAVAKRFPRFPIVLETVRECMRDIFDVPALVEVLSMITRREIQVVDVETERASPFARGLVFQYIAAWLYEGDMPLAERRAQALTLDRGLLAELLGSDELRNLIDADAVSDVESELQRLDDPFVADADHVHDALRRLGDLTVDELNARAIVDVTPLLALLMSQRRVVVIRIGGKERYIAVEDAARYRDALGVVLPQGIPSSLLGAVDDALVSLVARYARTHGPFFETDVAARFGVTTSTASTTLQLLETRGAVVHGDIRPGGTRRDWCDADVLKRLKRRSLTKLRGDVAPVTQDAYARFLIEWHGLLKPRRGTASVVDVVKELEGIPIPFSDVDAIFSARISDYRKEMLDEAGAAGMIVWVGAGALSATDGRVMLFRRDALPSSISSPPAAEIAGDELSDVARHIEAALSQKGASFFFELMTASGAATHAELTSALAELVFKGVITNDTFQPLRALKVKVGRDRAKGPRLVGGRFSLVRHLTPVRRTTTEDTLALCESLLASAGVVCRAHISHREIPGGFSSLYPVLRELSERGRVRRGHFIDGMGGAQFSAPGAADALRAAREVTPSSLVLAATDPANPWGSVFPWPESLGGGGRPRRAAGAQVVLVDGEPVFFIEKSSMVIFTDDRVRLGRAVETTLKSRGWKSLRVTKVNGAPAADIAILTTLLDAGFAKDHKGLVLQRVVNA